MGEIEQALARRESGAVVHKAHAFPAVALANGDQPVSLGEFLAPLRHGCFFIFLGAILGLGAALALAWIETPVYEARTLIEVQGLNSDFLNARSVDPSAADPEASAYLQTQMKMLESDLLVERVAARLDADKRPEFRFERRTPLDRILRRPGGPLPSRQRLLEKVADGLRVRALGTSRIIEVSYGSRDPRFAARFVNTLAEEFIRYSVDNRLESARTVARQLGEQLQDLKSNLEKSENELQDYARKAGLVFTAGRDSVAEGRLTQLQEALLKAQDARVQEQARYERVLASPPEALPEVLDDATLRSYQVKLTELKQQAADLSATLKPAHYRVKQVQAQIDTLQAAVEAQRANILRRLKTQYDTALNRENMLAQYYRQQAGLVADESAKAVRYDVLKREVDTNRQLYDGMLQRVKEAGIASAVRAAHLRVAAPARTPDFPVSPKPPIYAAAGLLAGSLAGMLLAFVRPAKPAVIRGPGDANVYLSVPELAVIPDVAKCGGRDGLHAAGKTGDTAGAVQLASWNHPYSRLAECFRGAAASVLFSTPSSTHRVIVVTSAMSGEGKTTVAANLGIMLAAAGHRVLLVDGDLRRPSLDRIFAVDHGRGLSELLGEQHGDRRQLPFEFGCWTDVPGLSVLPSGAKPADAGSLLCSRGLPRLIEHLRQSFEMVVIDTPPLALSDARVFGRLADGVVLVVRAGRTSAGDASSALLRLGEDGTRVLGTVVNQWNPKRSSAGAYGSYMYHMPDSYFKV